MNPFCNGTLDMINFAKFNFLIPVNLGAQHLYEGELTVILKFAKTLEEQYQLIYMPQYKKVLEFNSKYEPSIEFVKETNRKRKHIDIAN